MTIVVREARITFYRCFINIRFCPRSQLFCCLGEWIFYIKVDLFGHCLFFKQLFKNLVRSLFHANFAVGILGIKIRFLNVEAKSTRICFVRCFLF